MSPVSQAVLDGLNTGIQAELSAYVFYMKGYQATKDDKLKELPEDTPPAKCYIDTLYSYASNEIAINWNAPLAYVLGAMMEELIQVQGIKLDY